MAFLVGEIDQHFTSRFVCQFSIIKKLQTQTVSAEKLHKTLLYKKAACTMLVKSTTAQTNISSVAFWGLTVLQNQREKLWTWDLRPWKGH